MSEVNFSAAQLVQRGLYSTVQAAQRALDGGLVTVGTDGVPARMSTRGRPAGIKNGEGAAPRHGTGRLPIKPVELSENQKQFVHNLTEKGFQEVPLYLNSRFSVGCYDTRIVAGRMYSTAEEIAAVKLEYDAEVNRQKYRNNFEIHEITSGENGTFTLVVKPLGDASLSVGDTLRGYVTAPLAVASPVPAEPAEPAEPVEPVEPPAPTGRGKK